MENIKKIPDFEEKITIIDILIKFDIRIKETPVKLNLNLLCGLLSRCTDDEILIIFEEYRNNKLQIKKPLKIPDINKLLEKHK